MTTSVTTLIQEGDDPKSVFWFRSKLESLQGLSIIQNRGRSTDSSEVVGVSARFTEKQRALFFGHYFPWAIRAGMASTNLRIYFASLSMKHS
ncbi:hypothetical protein C4D60_Mb04t05180 [Musa balbisiana]|uniref:Uncharacterized protein n=1 Tax=Musa balbisiana TaxID=52838 RepID=A0A4S8K9R9_MUSBA|nr:hypothetical protein C4D60_Mb04t05180 [Musa balbisiana]